MVILSPAVFDPHVLAVDEARFLEALPERGVEGPEHVGRSTMAEADHRHRGLLRVRYQRPCRRAAKQRDEVPPLQNQHRPPRGSGMWSRNKNPPAECGDRSFAIIACLKIVRRSLA
jgi:hypothetical protein